ncbi:MAG: hypothetical protein GH151_05710 [Bacteroidetes bacterium]|nr:hypothetical protein [Bacteroidota bacterium]
MENKSDCFYLGSPSGMFSINKDDKLTLKLAMLIENRCLGIPVTEVVKKYGFSRSRFYQIKRAYAKGGSEALREGKRGPSRNYKRTDTVVNQIIRHRFLDPDTTPDVITQKMRQVGYDISKRSVERTITEYGFNQTKRKIQRCVFTPIRVEREVREQLARKVSSNYLGLWLLIPEHLRLGSWDLVKSWSGGSDEDIEPRLALQLIHESALCVSGVRPTRSLCHQGFELLNGLPDVATDKSIHELLETSTIAQSQSLQIALGKLRYSRGHYDGKLLAFDPHRIATYTRRIMPAKKSKPNSRARKVLQTFFCVDAITGQPIASTIGSSATTTSKAALELKELMKSILSDNGLVMADTEHATAKILNAFYEDEQFDILMPMFVTKKIKKIMQGLTYQRQWAGYALAETSYRMQRVNYPLHLIAQRSGEIEAEYQYKPFVATGISDLLKMVSEDFPERWTIEEFFNFEAAIGWNRAATMNLNIRYGKMSLALIAQAATFQLRQKLPKPYKVWTAKHLADSLFHSIDGDLKVKDDTIIVTLYNVPENLNLKRHYGNLPQKLEKEGVDPRIPWLFNFKVDFRFK